MFAEFVKLKECFAPVGRSQVRTCPSGSSSSVEVHIGLRTTILPFVPTITACTHRVYTAS